MAPAEGAAATVAAVVLLEVVRLLWHGRLQGDLWLVACHAMLAASLALRAVDLAGGGPVVVLQVATVAVGLVGASRYTLASKRRGELLASVLSGLSSYPVELAALAAVTWSCWPWGLLAWPAALYMGGRGLDVAPAAP